MYKRILNFFIIFILLYCNLSENNDKNIHINLILQDKEYYNFSRLVFFPEHKIILLIFFNPESLLEYDSEKLNPSMIDFKKYEEQRKNINKKLEIFEEITGNEVNYYIQFNKDNFIRFIDFIEGLYLFLPTNLELKEQNHIHLSGNNLYFGEKLYEYISSDEYYESGNYHIISQNKHFRFETMLLNLIYQLRFKTDSFRKDNQLDIIYKFINTNMNKKELQNFFEILLENHFLILELPLVSVVNKQKNETELFVHINKAKQIYQETLVQLNHLNNQKEPITLEILNASGVNRLANSVKASIDSQYYKVLAVDNFPYYLEETFLISNNGNSIELNQLKNLLYIHEKNIFFIRRIKDVEFSYILGKDFNIKKLSK
ncbi:MAG: hypothetical protein KatS3mg129_0827 [Leptospiraceae bacterium]|nr:MAG: hypothetical protein KatS3mg129_0827 [Leptospiraceae bacterium]